jgi:hypothetical protein
MKLSSYVVIFFFALVRWCGPLQQLKTLRLYLREDLRYCMKNDFAHSAEWP